MMRIALVVTLGLSGVAHAQEVREVRFAPGDYGTMVEGSVTGRDYDDLKLAAQGGQELFAEMNVLGGTGNGTAYFNILPPESDDVAIFIGSVEGTTARLTLPEDGVYTIRVYLMGDDRDAGARVEYGVDLSIQ